MLRRGLVYGRYSAAAHGAAAHRAARAAGGGAETVDRHELVRLGYARVEGLRFEDFLPVSAAGIFASNLQEYGTKSTAPERPMHTQAMFERMLGKPVIDADSIYKAVEANSLIQMYAQLGLWERLPAPARSELEHAAALAPHDAEALIATA